MKQYLYLIYFLSLNIFAIGHLSHIKPGVTLYSEYYPNTTTKFKGTIIFENGSGTDISEWVINPKFINCVKRAGSLFLYDRNGLGKSPADFHLSAHNPITGKLISDKLTILLRKTNIKPPYVFVAHSYGAIYAGYYVLKNPHLVKGVILVDPVPKNFHFSTKLLNKYKPGVEQAKKFSSRYIYKKYKGSITEVIYQLLGFNESLQSIKQLGGIINNIPVVVISSTGMENEHPLKEGWYESQKQWLNNNSYSKIMRVSSDHFIQLKKPQVVCDEIVGILNQ